MKSLVIAIFLSFGVYAVSGNIFGNSIYQIDSGWKDYTGKNIKLSSFEGQKVIISMIYTKCPHACPMTIAKIQKIEKELSGLGINDYKIVLASFDPKRDTPEHLKKYREEKKLDEKWTFISAPSDSEVRELAAVLGISYKPLADGEFSHSNIIPLLDEKGVMIAKIDGLSSDIAPLVKAFKKKK